MNLFFLCAGVINNKIFLSLVFRFLRYRCILLKIHRYFGTPRYPLLHFVCVGCYSFAWNFFVLPFFPWTRCVALVIYETKICFRFGLFQWFQLAREEWKKKHRITAKRNGGPSIAIPWTIVGTLWRHLNTTKISNNRSWSFTEKCGWIKNQNALLTQIFLPIGFLPFSHHS